MMIEVTKVSNEQRDPLAGPHKEEIPKKVSININRILIIETVGEQGNESARIELTSRDLIYVTETRSELHNKINRG